MGADGLQAVCNGPMGLPTGGRTNAGILRVVEKIFCIGFSKRPQNRPFRLNYHSYLTGTGLDQSSQASFGSTQPSI